MMTENTGLIRCTILYVIELYREITEENGAPSLGTQNQAVDFILADPQLSRAVQQWGGHAPVDEASTAPPRRLPGGEPYRRIREFMLSIMETPVFERKNRD